MRSAKSDRPPPRCPVTSRNAFTLVELLVVITIIVILIALLAPAMDQAVYQAELAQCGAKLDGYGTAIISGAVVRQRRYPQRFAQYMPHAVNYPSPTGEKLDERDETRGYLDVNLNALLNCPLSRPVDIDGSDLDSVVITSYAMWHNWLAATGEKTMRRLGDRWSGLGGDGGRYHFNVLAQDHDFGGFSNDTDFASHPDRDGLLSPYFRQDAGTPYYDKNTWSTWSIRSPGTRGVADFNAVMDDGSVHRYGDVKPRLAMGNLDERFAEVPRVWRGVVDPTNWFAVPKQ